MDNARFWDARYASLPELGSGPGSRGYAAWCKRRLIEEAIRKSRPMRILDIGCGDLCWMSDRAMDGIDYLGLDISETVVQANRARHPHLRFAHHDIVAAPAFSRADLVLCLDVLLHQLAEKAFTSALAHVLQAIDGTGLISYLTPGREKAPTPAELPPDVREQEKELERLVQDAPSARAQFHGALPDRVRRLTPAATVDIVGRYRYQTVYSVRL